MDNVRIVLLAPRICCPYCNALQFVSKVDWRLISVDESMLTIKCRRCKRLLPLIIDKDTDGS